MPPPLDVDNDDDDVVDASDKIKRPVNRHNKHKVTVSFHAPLTLAISLHGEDRGMILFRVRRFRMWQMGNNFGELVKKVSITNKIVSGFIGTCSAFHAAFGTQTNTIS